MFLVITNLIYYASPLASIGGATPNTFAPTSPSSVTNTSSTPGLEQVANHTPTLTVIPTETLLPTPGIMLRNECPVLVNLDVSPLWLSGSILFAGEEPGIWAISANNPMPTLVYEQSSWAVLSADNLSLLQFAQNELGSIAGESIIFNLVSKEETRTLRQADWFFLWDWLPDGRIKYLVSLERTFDLGEKREFALVDPITGQSETIGEELNLPGYEFYEEPFYTGIASVDPINQLVLYTIRGEKGTSDVALHDRQTGSLIWQQEGIMGTHGYPHPEPEWTEDSNHVLFSMPVLEEGNRYYKFFSLTRDGQVESLPPQPFPLLDQDWQLGYLDRSPGGRYIHYSVWQVDREGPGFIVDTISSQVGEICDSESTFLDGRWISADQLLYRVKGKDGGKSLRVLDIPTWTSQILVESGSDSGLFAIGWTPVEFP